MNLVKKNKNKLIVIGAILLVLTLGVSFAYWTYSSKTSDNHLISGDIYMKYTEGNTINMKEAMPSITYDPTQYFQFSITGKNNYKNKDIVYDISLDYGKEPDETTGRTKRIKDELLRFRLVEIKNGIEEELIQNGSYSNLQNKRIWIDRVSKNTTEEVDKTYRLYMWVSNDVKIGNMDGADYDAETWNNKVFASINVNVTGDFEEKELTDDYLLIHATEIDSGSEYDLNTSPMTNEDIKVTLGSKRKITSFVVNKVSDTISRSISNQEYTASYNETTNAWEAEVTISETGTYEYYAVYQENKNSSTYTFKININSDRYTLVEKPTVALCKTGLVYNGTSQDLVEKPDQDGYTFLEYQQTDAGTHQVKAHLKDKYRWSDKSLEDTTIDCSIDKAIIIVTPDSGQKKTYNTPDKTLTYTYTGNYEEPAFIGNLKRQDGENAGTYPINLGDLQLEDKEPFKKDNYKLELSDTEVLYTIEKATPVLKLSSENGEVLEGKEVVITASVEPQIDGTYEAISNQGTIASARVDGNQITITGVSNGLASITVTFKPTDNQNYNDSEAKTYSVNGYKIASEAVCSNPTYNGSLQPLATGGIGIELQNNSMKDANTYQVTEKLIDGYRWSDNSTSNKILSCTINPKPVTNVTVNLGSTDFTYNGSEHQPTVTSVLDGSIPLTLITDYTVSYSNNTNAGTNTAKVIITGQNNYTGTKEVPFTIKQVQTTLRYSPASLSVVIGTNGTFTITAPTSGTFNVTSQVSGTASVTSVTPSTGTSTTITVHGEAAGSTTLDVIFTPTDNVNYKGSTGTYSVTVLTPAVTQLKEKLGQGGLVGVTDSNTKTTSSSAAVREYRYSGLGVKNYVRFNNELWRILGIFKDDAGQEHMKIVRDEVLPADAMPDTYTVNGTSYKIRYSTLATAYWNEKSDNSSSDNNWVKGGLKYWLNSEGTTGGYLNSLTDTAQGMVEETTWYLGNVHWGYSTISSYEKERNSTKCSSSVTTNSNNKNCYVWPNNEATWNGKIGLMYQSDYGFASDSSNWSKKELYSDYGIITGSSWLHQEANHTDTEWFLSPSTYYSNYVAAWSTRGSTDYHLADSARGVRPTLYLKSDVAIIGEGTGESTNPYQLSCTSCTVTSSPSNQEDPTIFDDNVGNNANTKNIATTGTCNNLVYNGETQDLVSGGSDTSYTNNNQIDAGTYQVTAKANTGYTFSDGTTTKTLNCDISKKIIPVNFNTNTLKYNGTYQSPIATATGVKGEVIELETTKEKELGEYTTIATMKNVNPNYSLSNTVLDYKITNTNESNKITNITKVKVNYYLKNKDIDSYSLVKSIEQDAKVGETVTGELINFTNYKTPKEISIKIIKGVNVIDYYYERES